MNVPTKIDVKRCEDRVDFDRVALRAFLDKVSSALSNNGRCSIAISGGKTPVGLFELLAKEEIDWSRIDIFWVDERCVPSDSTDSNLGMVQRALFSKISIPEKNIHSVVLKGYSPAEAANAYEMELKKYFRGQPPAFDLVLLGLGVDGHTASLFPHEVSLDEKRWVIAVDGKYGDPSVPRVTLTLPVINNAQSVVFLVSGDNKRTVVDDILSDRDAAQKKYPAAMVRPRGELTWIIS